MSTIEWSASLLAAHPLKLYSALKTLVAHNIKCIHYDIMDLHYVNNLGLNLETIAAINTEFPELHIDLHYMVSDIDRALALSKLENLKIRRIFFHPETSKHPRNTITKIQEHGINAGIAICATESLAEYQQLLAQSKYALLMSVTPGFSGQKFQTQAIEQLRKLRQMQKNTPFSIAIDGGINPTTLAFLRQHQVQHAVLGSALFNNKEIQENLSQCKHAYQDS